MTWSAGRAWPPLRFPQPDSGLARCGAAALILLAAAALAAAQDTRFLVGVGEVKITPPKGTRMAGFSARQGPSRGVHDDLFVKTLVVSGGETSVALVTCEVIGVDRPLVEEIRRRAARQTGLPAESILIAATHTHSGPVLQGEYEEFFVRSAVESIVQAWRARRPRKLGSGIAPHGGWVGMNRRRLESGFSPVDKEIQVLKVTDFRGRVEAVLFNYPCHPACLGPDNLLISADWPYFAAQRLRERLGKTVKVLYFQGTQGNINTGYSAGLSALGVPIPTRTFTYAQELGEIVAGAILSKLPAIPSQSGGALSSRRDTVALEYYIPSTLEEAQRKLAQAGRQVEELAHAAAPRARLDVARVERAFAEYSLKRLERNLKDGQREYRAELQVIRVGDAAFVSFPGEFFVEVGLEVKKRSGFATTFCLGLANDNLGYFPISEAYAEGGYEVSVARFGPRSATSWQDAAARLLEIHR
jgi:hypothetical protein